MSLAAQVNRKDTPGWRWLVFACILVVVFVLLQLPAAWILARIAPNHPYLDNVSGNIWHGQGDWHYQNVQGVVTWQVRPWMLLLFRASASVELTAGDAHLDGVVTYGRHRIQVDGLRGRIDPETLRAVMPWQWPASPVVFHDVAFTLQDTQGFADVGGALSWGGGLLAYPNAGHMERANLPLLLGTLSTDKDRLHLALTNEQKERMADLYLSPQAAGQPQMMLDVQLTQRLLQNVASYHGQAGLDTAVVSSRQPLSSVGSL